MADVKICDRCGCVFARENRWIKIRPSHSLLWFMRKQRISVEGDQANCVYRTYDICNDCLKDLERFLRGQAVEEIKEE